MSLFRVFGRSKERQRRAADRKGAQPRLTGDGLTPETAIKVLPPEDPTKVRAIREASRKTVGKWKPELLDVYAGMGRVEANRALDTMAAETQKMILLEGMFGKEGTTWKCGSRMYFDGGIQSQELVFSDGSKKTLHFDFAAYHSLAERVP